MIIYDLASYFLISRCSIRAGFIWSIRLGFCNVEFTSKSCLKESPKIYFRICFPFVTLPFLKVFLLNSAAMEITYMFENKPAIFRTIQNRLPKRGYSVVEDDELDFTLKVCKKQLLRKKKCFLRVLEDAANCTKISVIPNRLENSSATQELLNEIFRLF